eukprot:TRINITY_DN2214_c0_g2_i7.p1 TRINITY_DN2214_c0_g2~~TRINITY_DN2214_c0_g2_i7.p1  ORF type:complete len:358 (+),score=43.55 TRINITY_DN2214_c0_g2_i7:99-1172(+)
MQLANEADKVTVYVKRPLKHLVPHLDDMQSKKNPFHKSTQSATLPLSRCSTVTTSQKGLTAFSSTSLTTAEAPSLPRPRSVRIPLPEGNTAECEDSLTDDECDMVNETSTSPKFITTVQTHLRAKLTAEVAFHLATIRAMPAITLEDVALRSVELSAQPRGSSGKTLVLDMDDTLAHTLIPMFNYSKVNLDLRNARTVMYRDDEDASLHSIKIVIRPYAVKLLQELSKVYEIIIFTAAEKCYADAILDVLDPEKKFISKRIYRENCIIKDKYTTKDLRVLENRNLKNVVIVDNTISCFAEQLSNGIHVPSYFGARDDNSLEKVLSLLKEIASCETVAEELDKRVGLKSLYDGFIKNN